MLLALASVGTLAPLHAGPEPYRNLRDTELGYHGPSDNLASLTELRIGWFGPSDPDDPFSGDLWYAASLAIADANAGPGLPLRLIPRWSSDPWGTGVSQLTRMVYDEQPLALLGSIDSAATHLAEQVVAKAQLPLVSPIATDPSLTLAGVAWMFSCAPSDEAIARTLVDALPAPMGVRSPFLLLSTTDHESRMCARSIMRECSRRGYAPALRLEFAPGTAEFGAQMRVAAEVQPQSVIIIAGADDAARLTRAVRSALGAVDILGGPSMGRRRFHTCAGEEADGVRFPLLFAPSEDARAAAFVARFTAARGHAPDHAAALTFDAARLLAAAIREAGPNRARVRDRLIAMSPWDGIAGQIDFDGTGQNRRTALALGTIRDGRIIPVHTASPTARDSSAPLP